MSCSYTSTRLKDKSILKQTKLNYFSYISSVLEIQTYMVKSFLKSKEIININ